jgi:hypothetical protein
MEVILVSSNAFQRTTKETWPHCPVFVLWLPTEPIHAFWLGRLRRTCRRAFSRQMNELPDKYGLIAGRASLTLLSLWRK